MHLICRPRGESVKVLFLNTFDIAGGAGRGAYRHHKGLQNLGVESRMLVQNKNTHDDSIMCSGKGPLHRLRARLRNFDLLPLLLYPTRRWTPWSTGWLKNGIARRVARENADLIHLHWVCHGFVPISAVAQFKQPVVWQLADPWAFTGGCHYPQGCTRYRESCGFCPQLGSKRENDLSRWTWKQKKTHWKAVNLTIVTQSRWMRDLAKESSLFSKSRVETIPAGLDENTFAPLDKIEARTRENLPLDKKIILVGAIHGTRDPRKGFHDLVQALKLLAGEGWNERAILLVFGGKPPAHPPDIPLQTVYAGYVPDDRLIRFYSAADVFVAPSREEAFGQTALESLASGTPCVGFDVGGLRDTILHQRTGYLAQPYSATDLATGIAWILGDDDRRKALSENARKRVLTEFTMASVARRYLNLYEDVLGRL